MAGLFQVCKTWCRPMAETSDQLAAAEKVHHVAGGIYIYIYIYRGVFFHMLLNKKQQTQNTPKTRFATADKNTTFAYFKTSTHSQRQPPSKWTVWQMSSDLLSYRCLSTTIHVIGVAMLHLLVSGTFSDAQQQIQSSSVLLNHFVNQLC